MLREVTTDDLNTFLKTFALFINIVKEQPSASFNFQNWKAIKKNSNNKQTQNMCI